MKKKIAIVGTQGVPAKYGGFETLAENLIGENRSRDIQYTVFCSSKDIKPKLTNYKDASLKYIPLRANGIYSIPYDVLSLIRSVWGYDVVLVLGVSGCIFLPFFCLLFRGKLIVNIDGLEHRRGKWNCFAKRFLRLSESMAVTFADIIVVDNKGIQDYVSETYRKSSTLITYGGNHVLRDIKEDEQLDILNRYNLNRGKYCLKISRIEPENNCKMILDAFAKTGDILVYVGNWERSAYSKELKKQYSEYFNINLIDSLYDLKILFAMRNNCKFYIHGHSAGGTNPSLVEAMFFGRPILAYDVIYNKETTEYRANYFKDSSELSTLISKDLSLFRENASEMQKIANRRYTWEIITKQYESLY